MTRQGDIRMDPGAWMEQALGILALQLRHEVSLTRVLRGTDRQEGFLGLFLSDEEAGRLLDELAGNLPPGLPETDHLDGAFASLNAARAAALGGVWACLAQDCYLTEIELDLLVLAAAPALDPRFGRVYGYLNDDMARRYLTPALALRLLDRHGPELTGIRAMFGPRAPLRAHRLIRFEMAKPFIESVLRIDEDLLDRLLGQGPATSAIPVVTTGHTSAGCCLLRMTDDPGPALIGLASGAGCNLRFLSCDTLAAHSAASQIADALRDARLDGALLVLIDAPALPVAEVAPHLTAPCVILTDDAARWQFHGIAEAQMSLCRAEALDLVAAPSDLAMRLRQIPAHIPLLEILRNYHNRPDANSMTHRLTEQAEARLGKLATHVTSGFGLDDIILPAPTREALQNLVQWHRTAPQVLQEWGLGQTFNKRPALTGLFKGPSGTGKTMAASVVANTLKLPLYRIDLARMVSKYIGETEKNLDALFSAAESCQVVLFFDEADAIFGQRSEVSDAHDRYANLETSYLLQRMETFSGISILASNLAQNMDDAFLRRIDMVIEFPVPNATERRALWARIKDTRAPCAPDLDLDLLAEQFELTGGEIRNCWLSAAHLAARRGGMIDTDCLMRAIGGELTKQGKAIRKSDFGDHYAGVRAGT